MSFRTDDSAVAEGLHLDESAIQHSCPFSLLGVYGGVGTADDEWISADKWIYRLLFSSAHSGCFLVDLFTQLGATFVAETLNSDVLHMRHANTHTHALLLRYYQPVSGHISWF